MGTATVYCLGGLSEVSRKRLDSLLEGLGGTLEAVPLKVFPQDPSSPIVGAMLHRCRRRRPPPPPPPPPPLPPPPPPLRPTHTPKTLTHVHSHPDSLTFILNGAQTHFVLLGYVSSGLLVIRPPNFSVFRAVCPYVSNTLRLTHTQTHTYTLRVTLTQTHPHSDSLTQTTPTQARLTLSLRGCLELGAGFNTPRGAPPGRIAQARWRPDCGDVLSGLRVWLSRLPFFQSRL